MNSNLKARGKSLIKKRYTPFYGGLVCLVFYGIFLVDSHVRRGLEEVFGLANGAEVNIGSFRSHVLAGTLVLQDMAFTNPQRPSHNRLGIGTFKAELSWWGLLKGSLVIEKAEISDISINGVRQHAGWVLARSDEAEEEQTGQDGFKELGISLSQLFGDNVSKMDPRNIPWQDLPSQKKIAKLKAQLKAKPQVWQDQIKDLPQNDQLQRELADIRNTKFSGSPADIAQQLKDLKPKLDAANKHMKNLQSVRSEISDDLNKMIQDINNLDDLTKDDLAYLKGQYKMPDLNFKELGMQLFGSSFKGYVQAFGKAQSFYQHYIAPPKPRSGVEEGTMAADLAASKSFRFPGQTVSFHSESNPRFWLKKMVISSRHQPGTTMGNLDGDVLHISSDQKASKQEARISLKGDFPSEGITGIDFQIKSDHRSTPFMDQMAGSIAAFPLAPKVLSEDPSLKFSLKGGVGQGDFKGTLQGQQVLLQIDTKYSELDYDLTAKSPRLKGILDRAIGSLPYVEIMAQASGPYKNLKWTVETNLSQALEKGIGQEAQAAVGAEQAKLEKAIKGRLEEEKGSLLEGVNGYKKDLLGTIDQRKNTLASLQNTAKDKQSQAVPNKQMQKVKKDAADKLKDSLKNKFKAFGQ